MTYYRAWENQRFVRGLLREKQPELAAALEAAVRESPCLRCESHIHRFGPGAGGVNGISGLEVTRIPADLGVLRAVYAGCRLLP